LKIDFEQLLLSLTKEAPLQTDEQKVNLDRKTISMEKWDENRK